MRVLFLGFPLLVACVSLRDPESPADWFDAGAGLDVTEPLEFTEVPYEFPADDADGILAVSELARELGDTETTLYAPGDGPPDERDCPALEDPALEERVVEGVVTLSPHYYYKGSGCTIDSEEKYYGSYFLQDRTGGIFVTADTKVHTFGVGDRVRLRVRALRNLWTGDRDTLLPAIYAHDVLEVVAQDQPLYWRAWDAPATDDDVAEVLRLAGTVEAPMTNFGDLCIRPDWEPTSTCTDDPADDDDGWPYHVKIDQELARRGFDAPVGTRLQATGPLIDSYGRSLVIMQRGQLEVGADD